MGTKKTVKKSSSKAVKKNSLKTNTSKPLKKKNIKPSLSNSKKVVSTKSNQKTIPVKKQVSNVQVSKTSNKKSITGLQKQNELKIKEYITTIADDILETVEGFKKLKLKQLVTNLKFDTQFSGVPIHLDKCVTLKNERKKENKKKTKEENKKPEKKEETESIEFVAFQKTKKIRVRQKQLAEPVKEKGKLQHQPLLQKGFEIKEVITDIVVHKKECNHLKNQKNKAKLGKEIPIKASKYYNVPNMEIEKWVHFLSENEAIIAKFPVNIFADIVVEKIEEKETKRQIRERDLSDENKRKIQEYIVERDGITSKVIIWEIPTENVGIYELVTPKIGPGTRAVLKGIGKELTNKVKVTSEDITDPKKMMELKETFKKMSEELLSQTMPNLDKSVFDCLSGMLLHHFYGLGILELLVADDNLEEIVINSSTEAISVFHRKYGWLKTTKYIASELDIYNFSSQIGRKVGQQINSLNPIMDAHLLTGDRVASTIFPISTSGNTITIRRFSRSPWSLISFVSEEMHLFSKEIASLIWLCMQYELNVLVAGGTASGKTSVLNILSSMITPKNRIISIEDTREIQLPSALVWNWVPLTCKRPNAEGQGEVSMLDLIVAALRMRPDRIIVGEIRKPEQAQALFEAMHTGHSVYATMHADTASQVVDRLKEMPMNVPETELEALHLIVMQYRDRRTGKRRTREVVEVVPTKDGISLNHLYRWQPRTDRFEKVNDSIRIFEELSLHTGLTPQEIQDDLSKKADILQWLLDNKVTDHDIVGEIFRFYYKDPDWLYTECRRKTVQQVLDEVNKKDFSLEIIKEKELHYKKDTKEEIIEEFYKRFEVYNKENWLKFLKSMDLSNPKINEELYHVKSELEK